MKLKSNYLKGINWRLKLIIYIFVNILCTFRQLNLVYMHYLLAYIQFHACIIIWALRLVDILLCVSLRFGTIQILHPLANSRILAFFAW